MDDDTIVPPGDRWHQSAAFQPNAPSGLQRGGRGPRCAL